MPQFAESLNITIYNCKMFIVQATCLISPGVRVRVVVPLCLKSWLQQTSDQYYKTITIVIMTIVSDATIWSVTYGHN